MVHSAALVRSSSPHSRMRLNPESASACTVVAIYADDFGAAGRDAWLALRVLIPPGALAHWRWMLGYDLSTILWQHGAPQLCLGFLRPDAAHSSCGLSGTVPVINRLCIASALPQIAHFLCRLRTLLALSLYSLIDSSDSATPVFFLSTSSSSSPCSHDPRRNDLLLSLIHI